MKVWFIILILPFFISCERHTQSGYITGIPQGQVVKLEGPDRLFASVSAGDYFQLEEDLSEGTFDLNTTNERGKLLLNESIKLELDLISLLLIKNGADPNTQDESLQTAFDLVEGFEFRDQWDSILNGNLPEPSYMNQQMVKLIDEAAIDTQDAVIKKLKIYLSNLADINTTDRRGFTLLMKAALKNMESIVTFIAQHPEVDFTIKVRRMDVIGLLKRQSRRNPELKNMIKLIEGFKN